MRFTITWPYPGFDESQHSIRAGNFYDISEWRQWLADLGYGFDINDVSYVVFHPENLCTIHQLRRNAEGYPFYGPDGEVAMHDPITVRYSTPPPAWT